MVRRSHDDALGVVGAETVIGAGVSVKGEIFSESDIMIDGTVNGIISTSGDVIVGVNANIKANIKAGNVTIAGHVIGDVVASGEAMIRETGQVQGDITASGLAITSGGIFVGRSHMQPQANPEISVVEPFIGVHEPKKRKL